MTRLPEEVVRAVGPGTPLDPEELVAVHVSSSQLTPDAGAERPEATLYRAMAQGRGEPARVRVRGRAGEGKTSVIYRAISESGAAAPSPQVLVLRCGEDPQRLSTAAEFVRLVIDTIRAQNGFASVDPGALARAAATQVTSSSDGATHGITVGAAPLQYRFDWKEVAETLTEALSPEQRRDVLIDAMTTASEDSPLTVVVDDTDRFAAIGADGSIDADSIHNLFEHGIKTLLDLPMNVVVAVHPTYDNVPIVGEVLGRGGFVTVDVPALPTDQDVAPLTRILERRLRRRAPDLAPDPLTYFSQGALAQLQAAYFDGGHDLRHVLRRCEQSARAARNAEASRVEITHVQTVLDQG